MVHRASALRAAVLPRMCLENRACVLLQSNAGAAEHACPCCTIHGTLRLPAHSCAFDFAYEQMTGFCTTWSGEGDALAGTRVAASDIEFSIDIDESGTELVRRRNPAPRL